MRIRSHLMLLVVLSVLPVIAFSVIMTVVLWRQQRSAIERGYLEGVRGMAIALDRAHAGIIQSLRVLSHSVHLDGATCAASSARRAASWPESRCGPTSCSPIPPAGSSSIWAEPWGVPPPTSATI